MPAARNMAAAVLLSGAAHEFVWLAWPAEMQGDVRAVTQWPLVVSLAVCLAVAARSRIVSAACAAVSIMSLTTSACSLVWLVSPWPVLPGADQCSERWGVPMLLVSGIAAVLALSLWRPPDHGAKSC